MDADRGRSAAPCSPTDSTPRFSGGVRLEAGGRGAKPSQGEREGDGVHLVKVLQKRTNGSTATSTNSSVRYVIDQWKTRMGWIWATPAFARCSSR